MHGATQLGESKMANATAGQVQLPPGYEDATPVAGPLANQSQSQNMSGISLPAGYEDAKPVAGPLAQRTSSAPPSDYLSKTEDAIQGATTGFVKGMGDTV